MSRAVNGNSRKPYDRPRARGSDDMWVHDKAPGVPASVINSTNGSSNNRASVNTKLVVSNLHYEVTAKDLIAVFGQIGTLVREPHIKYDRSGRSTGIAFLTYETPVEATRAKKQFDGILAKGQPMAVAFDTGPPTGPRQMRGGRGRAVSAPTSLMERIEKPALLDRLAAGSPQQKQNGAAAPPTGPSNGGPVRTRHRRGRGRNAGTANATPGSGAPAPAGSKPFKKEAKTADQLDAELEAFMGEDEVKIAEGAVLPVVTATPAAASGDVEMA